MKAQLKPGQQTGITIASVVVGFAAIMGALLYVDRADQGSGPAASPPAAADARPVVVSREELARNDGKNGHKCYVAVDGTVYLIENSPLWVEGRHETSNGRATCGRDLSEVIKLSPHGKSKLNLLTVVGQLGA